MCFSIQLDDVAEIYDYADTCYNADVSEIPKLTVKAK